MSAKDLREFFLNNQNQKDASDSLITNIIKLYGKDNNLSVSQVCAYTLATFN